MGGERTEELKHLWDISQDDKLRAVALWREKERRDRYEEMSQARREGFQEGLQKVRQERMQKEMEEGVQEGRRKMAASMLKDGFSTDAIEKYTRLTKKEIESLMDKE